LRCRRRGVLVVRGELDVVTAPALVTRLVTSRSIRVVDLSEVTFIDAAGLGALCDGARRAPQPIVVGAISANVARFLALAGIDHLDLAETKAHDAGSVSPGAVEPPCGRGLG